MQTRGNTIRYIEIILCFSLTQGAHFSPGGQGVQTGLE